MPHMTFTKRRRKVILFKLRILSTITKIHISYKCLLITKAIAACRKRKENNFTLKKDQKHTISHRYLAGAAEYTNCISAEG